jgi:hypothetical protein
MEVIRAGRTLLLAEAPHAKQHLWFVLTDPDGDPPQVAAVMLRTVKSFTDDTVTLDVGSHPFVRHRSCVHYSTARLFRVTAIIRALSEGQCHLRVDMTDALLQEVRAGVMRSLFAVPAIVAYCCARF